MRKECGETRVERPGDGQSRNDRGCEDQIEYRRRGRTREGEKGKENADHCVVFLGLP